MPTIKIELFFCLFLRNSALVWSRKISAVWRWTGRARWTRRPGGTFKVSPLCPPGDGPWWCCQGAWGRKGLWGCSEPAPESSLSLGNAGDSATLAQDLLLSQGLNSPFPPASASAATSNICPDGEGPAWHSLPFLAEEKGGKCQLLFHPQTEEFKLNYLPLENKPWCRSPLTRAINSR